MRKLRYYFFRWMMRRKKFHAFNIAERKLTPVNDGFYKSNNVSLSDHGMVKLYSFKQNWAKAIGRKINLRDYVMHARCLVPLNSFSTLSLLAYEESYGIDMFTCEKSKKLLGTNYIKLTFTDYHWIDSDKCYSQTSIWIKAKPFDIDIKFKGDVIYWYLNGICVKKGYNEGIENYYPLISLEGHGEEMQKFIIV